MVLVVCRVASNLVPYRNNWKPRREQVKRNAESVANVEMRSDRLDAYRLTALALVDIDAGNLASAANGLDQAAALLRKEKDPTFRSMGDKVGLLAQMQDNIKLHRADVVTLLNSFDTLVPRVDKRSR